MARSYIGRQASGVAVHETAPIGPPVPPAEDSCAQHGLPLQFSGPEQLMVTDASGQESMQPA